MGLVSRSRRANGPRRRSRRIIKRGRAEIAPVRLSVAERRHYAFLKQDFQNVGAALRMKPPLEEKTLGREALAGERISA
jgi:hypothetical protein